MPKATASAPIRTRAIAESLMLRTSVPASRSRRAASMVRSIRMLRGGSISTEITNRPAARARPRPVSGTRSPCSAGVSANAARGLAPEIGAPVSVVVPAARACARRASAVRRASSAARIAATCSGVVPQQPPMTCAPASSSRGTIEPKYSGPAA